jgi:acetylornithine deacetylase/succinyl-diaminopimelate desuccinylase-like protein
MVIKGGSFETSFNIDGIWGGNMYAGGAGAIMPNKITSKHNFRYVPRMNGLDIVKKLRAQLDKNGYKDVEMKLIGDVPWSRGSSPDTDITAGRNKGAEIMASLGLGGGGGGRGGRGGANPNAPPPNPVSAAAFSNGMAGDFAGEHTGGYWPSYLFTDGEVGEKVGTVKLPMGMGGGGGGGGGRAHAANEYYTVEAINKSGGMANSEKFAVAALYEYAKITTVPPRPKTSAAK